MKMKPEQLELIRKQLKRLMAIEDGFYAKKLQGIDVDSIDSQEAFEKLPYSDKNDLRDAYPLGLQAVPEEEVVRIHSSSGTTGTPVIIPYTAKDVDDWADMFARCYATAGLTNLDRVHVTPGYGLWTAGIGFQNGAERLGAMVIPMGPGNTDKQLKMMEDLKSTVLCATSSYALLLAEEIAKRGIRDKLCLKKGIIGSERWGDKMRARIADELGVKLYDIYGLTECYGPGIGISCDYEDGMHIWDDYVYCEIIDPKTGELLPDGELGELVVTTLVKETQPGIRRRAQASLSANIASASGTIQSSASPAKPKSSSGTSSIRRSGNSENAVPPINIGMSPMRFLIKDAVILSGTTRDVVRLPRGSTLRKESPTASGFSSSISFARST